jgi:sarcosine oxidase subunit beta
MPDVIVLGAGIIGTAIAYRLASAGVDVTLVDHAKGPGRGTSGRCDGNVLLQTKDDRTLIDLTQQGIDIYRRWRTELDLDIHFSQAGSLVVLTSPEQAAAARQRSARLSGYGIRVDWLDEAQLRELEPDIVPGLPAGLFCPDDAEVYPPAVVNALLVNARSHGCQVLTGTTAHAVVADKTGATRGVHTSTGMIEAPVVVNALGVWAPHLHLPVPGLPLPVRPRQGVLAVTHEHPRVVRHNIREASYLADRSDSGDDATPRISFAAEPTYRGNLLIGSSRAFTDYDTEVDLTTLIRIVQRAIDFFPALADVQIIRTFAGLRPWTPDNLPIIGRFSEIPGYLLATGHEGEGIGLAPATAELITALILNQDLDDLYHTAARRFSPDRFAHTPAH